MGTDLAFGTGFVKATSHTASVGLAAVALAACQKWGIQAALVGLFVRGEETLTAVCTGLLADPLAAFPAACQAASQNQKQAAFPAAFPVAFPPSF